MIISMPRQNAFSIRIIVWGCFWAACFVGKETDAFQARLSRNPTKLSTTNLFYSNDNSQGGNNNDSPLDAEWNILNGRLQLLRLEVLEKELQRPPQARLSACDFVKELLQCILDNEDPLPDSGFRLLLRTATDEWKRELYKSVGAPLDASEDVVASALGEAIGRPHNQYALLVGDAYDHNNEAHEEYIPTFPSEPLDYFDGTAWVECRLRSKRDNSLLVSTGWELQRNRDGAWMVNNLCWHDFRDRYRPGVGQEEWMRVCD